MAIVLELCLLMLLLGKVLMDSGKRLSAEPLLVHPPAGSQCVYKCTILFTSKSCSLREYLSFSQQNLNTYVGGCANFSCVTINSIILDVTNTNGSNGHTRNRKNASSPPMFACAERKSLWETYFNESASCAICGRRRNYVVDDDDTAADDEPTIFLLVYLFNFDDDVDEYDIDDL
jgi:hypothetical protein